MEGSDNNEEKFEYLKPKATMFKQLEKKLRPVVFPCLLIISGLGIGVISIVMFILISKVERSEKTISMATATSISLATRLEKTEKIVIKVATRLNITEKTMDNLLQYYPEPYQPIGPQFWVPLEIVTAGGWRKCFSATYDTQLNYELLDNLKKSCTGANLLLSCRMTNHTTLTTLAWGHRDSVLFKSTINKKGDLYSNIANGVFFYNFQTMITEGRPKDGFQGAMGFAEEGDAIRFHTPLFQFGLAKLDWE